MNDEFFYLLSLGVTVVRKSLGPEPYLFNLFLSGIGTHIRYRIIADKLDPFLYLARRSIYDRKALFAKG